MSAVNLDNVTPERLQASRRARRLLGGAAQTEDIDHDIRGSILAGHVQELPGFEGVYFNPGKDTSNPEFYDLHNNKVAGNAKWLDAYRQGGFDTGGGDGGPGGGSGGGGGDDGGGVGGGNSGDLTGDIEAMLRSGMSGDRSRFGDDTVRQINSQNFETGQARLGQQLGTINQSAAREGISGAAVEALRQRARSETGQSYTQGVRDLAIQKAQADYEDKQQALKDAMDYVDKTRQYKLGQAHNQNERDQIESEAAVARERIASESSIVDRQLAMQQQLAEMSAHSAAAGQNSSQNFQRSMAELRHSWDLENRQYETPFRLANLGLQYS